ncbi:MAG TPA: hypothetical protein VGF60_04820 [Xanthobacteraceae bacterium]|jgi:hypothetical protein
MSGWLRYLAVNARARTGYSPQILIWVLVAAAAAAAALIFLCIAAFVWLARRYDPIIAALVLFGFFVLVAVIALAACLAARRRNIERARKELATRSNAASWLDPKLLAVGMQVGQTIGWRRIVWLAAAALLAAGVAKEWGGRAEAQREDGAAPPESQA